MGLWVRDTSGGMGMPDQSRDREGAGERPSRRCVSDPDRHVLLHPGPYPKGRHTELNAQGQIRILGAESAGPASATAGIAAGHVRGGDWSKYRPTAGHIRRQDREAHQSYSRIVCGSIEAACGIGPDCWCRRGSGVCHWRLVRQCDAHPGRGGPLHRAGDLDRRRRGPVGFRDGRGAGLAICRTRRRIRPCNWLRMLIRCSERRGKPARPPS